MPIPLEELAAYRNAAVAVAAFRHDVRIVRSGVRLNRGRRERTTLEPFDEFLKRRVLRYNEIEATSHYVTTLLSGSVGRVLGLEAYLGLPELHPEVARLRVAFLAEAMQCREPETDAAFALILAKLDDIDDAHPPTSFQRLWWRADTLLRATRERRRLDSVREALKQEQLLEGPRIVELLWKQ